MADSDDEYDRKRRDKFRGERSTGGVDSYRSERRDDRRGASNIGGRDEWSDRNPFRGGGGGGRPRPDYRDYRGGGGGGGLRDRYGSPGRDMPPTKRMRPDWGDDIRAGSRYGGYDPYLMHAWNEHYAHSLHSAYGHGGGHQGHIREPQMNANVNNSDMQTQPAMMSLKQFLDTQDDGISDAEVLRKYSDYKLEFKRQQLNEFFVAHKDEEWFKNKYHPSESVKRKDEQLNFLKKRVDVFKEVLENGQVKAVSVDTTQTDALLRLLDTVVIKLEGGTDEDLKILDEKPKEAIPYPERVFDKKTDQNDDDVIITSVEKKRPINDTGAHHVEPKVVSPRPIRKPNTIVSDEENWDEEDDVAVKKPQETTNKSNDDDEGNEKKLKKKKSMKRKRTNTDSSSSSSSGSDSSSSSSSEDDDDEIIKNKYDLEKVESKVAGEETEELVKAENKSFGDKTVKTDTNTKKEVNENDEKLNMENVTTTMAVRNSNAIDNKPTGVAANNGNANEDDNKTVKDIETEDKVVALTKTNENENKSGEEDSDKLIDKKHLDKDAIDDGESESKVDAVTEAEDYQTVTIDLDKEKDVVQHRALHRTSSIFLRNLAPSITKAEIENACKNCDGYLRVAIADPLVERRWYRRGWVTFKRDVNIKEICWNLNSVRLRDCEMGAIVNRDLSRRVRPVNGMTAHKTIVRADIKLCAKIALNLDEKFKLWDNQENITNDLNKETAEETAAAVPEQINGGKAEKSTNATTTYGFISNNPVLQNITDYLIEEASAEEDELLGISEKKDNDGETIDRDPQLLSVLDSLILYLRIVHSVDFYNHCEYPYEDEMPNRCGIIHARGPQPSKVSQNDILDYIKNFENKMQQFLTKTATIDDNELKNLGCKDPEGEIEKFVQANSQELAKDKWLCPLSGKKFKGPDFIRKHIFNKHVEKVDEVRKEVEFFNNYLKDTKRPQLPEHPGNTKRTNSESSGSGGGYRPPMYPPSFAPPYAAYAPPMMMPGRGRGGFGGVGGRRPGNEYRQLIQYRDLDAPQEPVDMFN